VPESQREEAGVGGPDVRGPHEAATGSGAALGQGVGLGAGGDVGGDAAQGAGDVLERSRPRAQRLQGLQGVRLLQIDIETAMDNTVISTLIAKETRSNRRILAFLNRNALTINILPPSGRRGKNIRVKRVELKWR